MRFASLALRARSALATRIRKSQFDTQLNYLNQSQTTNRIYALTNQAQEATQSHLFP